MVMVRAGKYTTTPLRASGVVGAVNVAENGVHVQLDAANVYVNPQEAFQ
jgi:hypothetical protein